jgi:AraC-like DNA-binding protein
MICYVIILLVPIMSSLSLYRYTEDTLTRKAYENGMMSVRQVRNVVDEQLKTVINVSNTICVSSSIVRLKYMSLPFNAAKYYEVHERSKYLANFSTQQALIKYIYAFCSNMDCLVDSGHIYTNVNQLDKIIGLRIGLNKDRFYELMGQSHQNDIYTLNGGNSIIMLQTLSAYASEKRPAITLIIVLNTDAIKELLKSTSETVKGSAYMLLPAGSVFGAHSQGDPVDYSTLSAMYGEGQITNNDLVVTYADSGVTNFRYVLSVPCSTFLRDISSMQLAFIYFMSGALVLGLLVAYMLARHNYKPLQQLKQTAQIHEKSSDDFSALGSRLKELLSDENQMHMEIEQLSRTSNAQLFNLLLTGNLNVLEQNQRKQLEGLFTGNVFVAALIDTGEDDEGATAEDIREVNGALNVLAAECAQNACQCVIQPHNNAFAAIFCFAGTVDRNDAQFFVQETCKRMLKNASSQPLLSSISIYVGDAKEGIVHVSISFANALKAKEYAEFITETENRVVLYDEAMYSCDIAWEDFDIVDAERRFTSLMMEGHYSRGNQTLREIMTYYKCRDGMSLYVMRCRMFGVMNMMLNVLHEVEPDLGTSFFEETNPVARLLSARTHQELEDMIFQIIDRLVGAQESKAPDIQDKITHVEHYIAAHYFDVGLGVKQVADAFNMSLPYLSRVFKKEKGFGLLNYINNYRVQKAKEIMKSDENATVADIAEKVGYNSSQTLIRIFKRYEGTTPGQFRDGPSEHDKDGKLSE